jgi:hypothetical protein
MIGDQQTGKGPVVATVEQLLAMNPADMSDEELRGYHKRLRTLGKMDLRQVVRDESHGWPEYQGFVYVLSNPAIPGHLKIGSTVGRVAIRARQLRTTGVPEPFKVESSFPVYMNPIEVEKRVHRVLEIFRSRGDREFFRVSVEYAVAAIESVLLKVQPPKT